MHSRESTRLEWNCIVFPFIACRLFSVVSQISNTRCQINFSLVRHSTTSCSRKPSFCRSALRNGKGLSFYIQRKYMDFQQIHGFPERVFWYSVASILLILHADVKKYDIFTYKFRLVTTHVRAGYCQLFFLKKKYQTFEVFRLHEINIYCILLQSALCKYRGTLEPMITWSWFVGRGLNVVRSLRHTQSVVYIQLL